MLLDMGEYIAPIEASSTASHFCLFEKAEKGRSITILGA